jgi:dTDP-4-dehydrorhamnose 3,5-epimerase-like enzyme
VLEFPELSFAPQRVYWITNFVVGTSRGHHAHKTLNQAMLMVKGSLQLNLKYGVESRSVTLDEDSDYILIPSGYWREMKNATRDAVLLVIADSIYDENDYIRDWDEYLEWFESQSHES